MKKIVIKEIDRLNSTLHKSRVTSEYLIYLMKDGAPMEAYTEMGEIAKHERVNDLIVSNFIDNDFNNTEIKKEDIITEIGFEDYKKQNQLTKTWKKHTL
jgi:uncharacterized protein YegL